ncbi:MAG: hypothetical protein D6714_10000, partial [Bacteroidetes bacterium]
MKNTGFYRRLFLCKVFRRTIFLGKNVAGFASGRRLRRRSIFGFLCVRFVEKRKVSLLTELENVGGWFSTKVPPLRGFLF